MQQKPTAARKSLDIAIMYHAPQRVGYQKRVRLDVTGEQQNSKDN